MTIAEALSRIDAIYAENRRATWTRLLTSGEPDLESIEETFAKLDRAFAQERERFVAWLKTLREGGTVAPH